MVTRNDLQSWKWQLEQEFTDTGYSRVPSPILGCSKEWGRVFEER